MSAGINKQPPRVPLLFIFQLSYVYWCICRLLSDFITDGLFVESSRAQLLVLKAHDSITGRIWAKALLRAVTWDENNEGLRMIELMKVRSQMHHYLISAYLYE